VHRAGPWATHSNSLSRARAAAQGIQEALHRYELFVDQIDSHLNEFETLMERVRSQYTSRMLDAKDQAKVWSRASAAECQHVPRACCRGSRLTLGDVAQASQTAVRVAHLCLPTIGSTKRRSTHSGCAHSHLCQARTLSQAMTTWLEAPLGCRAS